MLESMWIKSLNTSSFLKVIKKPFSDLKTEQDRSFSWPINMLFKKKKNRLGCLFYVHGHFSASFLNSYFAPLAFWAHVTSSHHARTQLWSGTPLGLSASFIFLSMFSFFYVSFNLILVMLVMLHLSASSCSPVYWIWYQKSTGKMVLRMCGSERKHGWTLKTAKIRMTFMILLSWTIMCWIRTISEEMIEVDLKTETVWLLFVCYDTKTEQEQER